MITVLGSNVSTVGGFETGFKIADEWECKSIQIYLTPSRTWKVPELTNAQINDFKSYWNGSIVKEVVAHIPFLVNLASPDKELRTRAINRMKTELHYAQQLGVKYLVLHTGSYTTSTRRNGLDNIIKSLNSISNDSSIILLETMAGQGTVLGKNFEEMQFILEHVDEPKKIGICFDTAHVFQSGYDLRGYKGFEKVFDKFDEIIGIEKLQAIHLNDSKTELGSKSDRHAVIGKGKIGLHFFHALLRDNRFSSVPKILEIPDRDGESKESLTFLRDLRQREKIKEDNTTTSIEDFF